LKSKSTTAWSAAKSEELYGFKRWGSGHFSVDSDGFATVQPLGDERDIRILDVVQEAVDMGLKAPMVIRFQDLLPLFLVRFQSATQGMLQNFA